MSKSLIFVTLIESTKKTCQIAEVKVAFTFIDFSIICAIEAQHAKLLVFYSLKKGNFLDFSSS